MLAADNSVLQCSIQQALPSLPGGISHTYATTGVHCSYCVCGIAGSGALKNLKTSLLTGRQAEHEQWQLQTLM